MKKFLVFLAAMLLVFGVVGTASASLITSYDIENAVLSGFGSWAHTYNGTMTNTGTTTVFDSSGTVANYSGGSGTLNDDNIGTADNNTQLFATGLLPELMLTLGVCRTLST